MLAFPKGYYVSKFPPDNLVVQTGSKGVQFLPFKDFISNIGGGGGGGESPNIVPINQPTHGFVVGDIVRLNSTIYVKALADTKENAEVVGIVKEVVDTNNFILLTNGYIENLSSLTAGEVYFLSDSTSGGITTTEPTTIGSVSKPLLIADSTTSGYFFNFRGLVIGDSTLTVGSTRLINQPAHGFVIGDILRFNGTIYVKALADTKENAEVVGIVKQVIDVDNFILLNNGFIDNLSGLTSGVVYFLSESNNGELTSTEPIINGYVSKPLLIADSTTSGYFFNFRGTVINNLISQAGLETIPLNNNNITVTFSTPLSNTNYVVVANLSNVTDITPSIYGYIITTKNTTDFTVLFSGNTDSANYILEWIVIGS